MHSKDIYLCLATLPRDPIKEKLGPRIKWSFENSGISIIGSNAYKSFLSLTKYKNYSFLTKDDMIIAKQ